MKKIGFVSTNAKLFAHFQNDMINQGIELIQLSKNLIVEQHIYSDLISIIIDIPIYNLEDFKWCKLVAGQFNTNVIVMSQDDGEHYKQTALDNGAQSVFYYPSSAALIKESNYISKKPENIGIINLGEQLQLNMFSHFVINNGKKHILSKTEFRLLSFFIFHQDQIIPTEQILEKVWGEGYMDLSQVYVYVRRLRCKIESNPKRPTRIIGQRGSGYMLSTK
jgi:DNA-binding response OmpR family regulator